MADAPGSGSIVTTGSFLVPGILAAAVVPFVSKKGGIFSINRVEVGVCAGGVAARTHPNPQFLRRYKRRVEITSKEAETARKEWHVAQWPPLAWLETIIKLAALILGIIALVQALTGGTFALPGGLRLVQLVILALLSLGLVAAIFDRLAEREIVAMIFVVINNLGHWGMVVALASEPGPGWLLPAFAGLILLGDLVKLVSLRVHDFTVRGTPKAALYGLTLVYVVGYLLILLLELVR